MGHSERPVRLLLINAWPSTNKGSAAMAITAAKALYALVPASEVWALIPSYDQASSAYPTRFSLTRSDWGKRPARMCWTALRAWTGGVWYGLTGHYPCWVNRNEVLGQYAGAAAVINLGGDTIDEIYGRRGFTIHAFGMIVALLLRKPVVIYAQSVGHLEKVVLSRWMLRRCALVIARERTSFQRLRDFGIAQDRLHLTADSAFLLEAASGQRAVEIIAQEAPEFLRRDVPAIGIAPAENIFAAAARHGYRADMVGIWSRLVEYVVTALGARVLIIAHDSSPQHRDFIGQIWEHVSGDCRSSVGTVVGDHQPEEIKSIIGQMDMFIGGRMHANIAALSMGVPTLALAYSDKFHGIMESAGQERWVLPLERFGFEEARVLVDRLWAEKDAVRQELQRTIPEVKREAFRSAEIVRDWLAARGVNVGG